MLRFYIRKVILLTPPVSCIYQ
uniref:Uncharacterized protein n=1 Tax=Anguilla anguilla TaxID=7936 RepID=A0A0E9TFU9_ANGAN